MDALSADDVYLFEGFRLCQPRCPLTSARVSSKAPVLAPARETE